MKISVSEFKARCTQVVRDVAAHPHKVEITKRGKVVAVVSAPPVQAQADPRLFWGSLSGSVAYLAPDFDEPMGDEEWEAAR